ncbi:hypothetical protein L2E82_39195 [Cichorium intybus]|uniref:Uncharacterized protein n=1 Tax=Cichorium intybus TaxID=13427 RepID=A0ACB9AIA8_CICIN|nr:hypothetical protein L2E82_39195 [Cichorium intybus]
MTTPFAPCPRTSSPNYYNSSSPTITPSSTTTPSPTPSGGTPSFTAGVPATFFIIGLDDNKERKEEEEEGEGGDDDRSWSSDDGESEDSTGEEEDEQAVNWEQPNKDANLEETFIADSAESAHACHDITEKRNVAEELDSSLAGRVGSGQEEIGGKPSKGEENKIDITLEGTEESFIQSGEVSNKLKKLLSRKVPFEEKLDMVGKELTETQRRIRVKEGRVLFSSTTERRITRSLSKKGREEAGSQGKGQMFSEAGSDNSMSIGVLQRLEEVGMECRMQQGRAGGNFFSSFNKKGSFTGKS